MLGILSPDKQAKYEAQWQAEIKNRQAQKQRDDYENPYQVDNFFFIADYTSGGIPCGITLEEEMKFKRAEEKVQELQAISKVLMEQEANSETTEETDSEL